MFNETALFNFSFVRLKYLICIIILIGFISSLYFGQEKLNG